MAGPLPYFEAIMASSDFDMLNYSPIAWYDASDESTIHLSDAVHVEQWDDKSGYDKHLTQGSVSLQPEVDGGGLVFNATALEFMQYSHGSTIHSSMNSRHYVVWERKETHSSGYPRITSIKGDGVNVDPDSTAPNSRLLGYESGETTQLIKSLQLTSTTWTTDNRAFNLLKVARNFRDIQPYHGHIYEIVLFFYTGTFDAGDDAEITDHLNNKWNIS